MSSWHGYTKIYNLGHAALERLFMGHVVVQEKVDGSQFSFGVINGELKIRSKSVDNGHVDKMFGKAVEWVTANQRNLLPEHTYRAEYLQKPKHNVLAYDRVPHNHLMVFDIHPGEEKYMQPWELINECMRIGLEPVPYIFSGPGEALNIDDIKKWLELKSALGGALIEGVVIKNYAEYQKDGKAVMGKHVSEKFKEVHRETWKTDRAPGSSDFVQSIALGLKTSARWQKAVQHLRDRGECESSPRDIGKLMAEVKRDTKDEMGAEVREALFNLAWPQIEKRIVQGLPEWYKNQLMDQQFAAKIEAAHAAATPVIEAHQKDMAEKLAADLFPELANATVEA